MAITTNVTSTHLTRSELWSSQLKEVLQDATDGIGYVDWLTEFPDGDQFTIPSIGEGTVRDYSENDEITFDSLDTGEFTFAITEYKSSGNYITKKARQDAYYSAQLESSFVPKQARALEENLVSDIYGLAGSGGGIGGVGTGQTANDPNSINGAAHRYAGTAVTPGNDAMAVGDIAKALFALKRANVPDSNLIAVVDPSVEFAINTLGVFTGFTSENQRWDDVVENGISNGMRFSKNIYGFDVYVSNYLARTTTATDVGSITAGNGVNNIFFSAAGPDILPFKGAWRQAPEVEGGYNYLKQREEYVTTARYGLKLYRPENLVVIVTDATSV
jgi:hypothetical protein|tara:strand:- start:2109 stop:3101 length:993 start_codon:yes stop_codon:yes gene_type:complete